MQRFWMRAGPALAAVVLPLLMASCSSKEPPRKLGETPPGTVGYEDPRFRGFPEEISDGKGRYTKKMFHKDPKKIIQPNSPAEKK